MKLSERQKLVLVQVLGDTLAIVSGVFKWSREDRVRLYNEIVNQQSDDRDEDETKTDE